MAILVVQRESPTRDAVVDSLVREGLEARAVPSVFHAVSEATTRSADGIVLDLTGLADRDLEVVPVLRELCPTAPVILTFPSAQRELAARGLALGADAYLPEPFYMEELTALLRRTTDPIAAPPPAPPVASEDHLCRLSADAAHEINNPLQIIQLILDSTTVPAPLLKKLRPPLARIGSVGRLLAELGQLERAEASTVRIAPLLEEALGHVPEVEAIPPTCDRDVRGHPEFLGATIEGLLRRAASDGGPVTVTCADVDLDGAPAVEIRIAGPAALEPEGPAGGEDPSRGPLFLTFCRIVASVHGGRLEPEDRSGGGAVYALLLPSLARGNEDT